MKPFVSFISIMGEGVEIMNSTEIKTENFSLPENVFKAYANMVYRLAFVRTKNRYDSEDIVQEVFMRYMKVCQKMESEEHIKAMLLRITVNCSNTLKTSYWSKKTIGLTEDMAYTVNGDDINLLESVLKLPLKYRTVIHLHYYCGYSVKEIAEITKRNPSTVKTHLNRARTLLKLDLEEDLYV